MNERTDELRDIEARLRIARDNLRQLTEQAAGYSGANDEDFAAQRIAEMEEEVARLTSLRDALAK